MGSDRRSVKTRANLQAALLEILREKPFEKVRIAEISRHAGVSRKAFYLYYENIYDLVVDSYDTFMTTGLKEIYPSSFTSKEDAVAWLIEYEKECLLFCRENPQFMSIVFENRLESGYRRRLTEISQDNIHNFLHDEYGSGTYLADDGCIMEPQGDTVHPSPPLLSQDFCAQLALAASSLLIQSWINDGFRESIDSVAKRLVYVGLYIANWFSSEVGANNEYLRAVLNH